MSTTARLSLSNLPAYISKRELKRQLSLSDGVIDRMVSKGLLPASLDFDGNQRWQWSEVEAYIAKNNKIYDHDSDNETDDIMAGINSVES
ncbi:MAG: helix-turn-helix transcriptional regulator [Methyloligellaceae bacterium]